MSRIDFYLITEPEWIDKLRLTCRLLEKAYEQNRQVFVCVETSAQASQLNDLLWTFKDISFIPHRLIGEPCTITPPIQIGYEATLPDHRDIFISLCDKFLEIASQFDRVIEIISPDPASERKKLDHTHFFKAKGFTINSYDLRNKTSPSA